MKAEVTGVHLWLGQFFFFLRIQFNHPRPYYEKKSKSQDLCVYSKREPAMRHCHGRVWAEAAKGQLVSVVRALSFLSSQGQSQMISIFVTIPLFNVCRPSEPHQNTWCWPAQINKRLLSAHGWLVTGLGLENINMLLSCPWSNFPVLVLAFT